MEEVWAQTSMSNLPSAPPKAGETVNTEPSAVQFPANQSVFCSFPMPIKKPKLLSFSRATCTCEAESVKANFISPGHFAAAGKRQGLGEGMALTAKPSDRAAGEVKMQACRISIGLRGESVTMSLEDSLPSNSRSHSPLVVAKVASALRPSSGNSTFP